MEDLDAIWRIMNKIFFFKNKIEADVVKGISSTFIGADFVMGFYPHLAFWNQKYEKVDICQMIFNLVKGSVYEYARKVLERVP